MLRADFCTLSRHYNRRDGERQRSSRLSTGEDSQSVLVYATEPAQVVVRGVR